MITLKENYFSFVRRRSWGWVFFVTLKIISCLKMGNEIEKLLEQGAYYVEYGKIIFFTQEMSKKNLQG